MSLSLRIQTLISLIGLSLTFTGCGDAVSANVKGDAGDVTQQKQSDIPENETDVSASQPDTAEIKPDAPQDDSQAPEDNDAVSFMPLAEKGDVVSFVEVSRYMGLWYEIATTPSFQQSSCSNTQAEYTFNEAMGWVDVVNTCYVGNPPGSAQQIQGRAELVDLETQAKLKVIFFGQVAPYWVVTLDGSEGDEPYQWVVVSVPGKQTMWLLSRTKQMTEEQRSAIEAHLTERGFPVDTLIDTPQGQ